IPGQGRPAHYRRRPAVAALSPPADSGFLQTFAAADNADGDALDGHLVVAQVELDRLEIRILGQQLHRVAAAFQSLDGHLVGDARDYDLAALRLLRAVHREQVAFEDARVAH